MDRSKNTCVPPEFTADMMGDIVANALKKSNRMDELEKSLATTI